MMSVRGQWCFRALNAAAAISHRGIAAREATGRKLLCLINCFCNATPENS
jgi:hypothetical protein